MEDLLDGGLPAGVIGGGLRGRHGRMVDNFVARGSGDFVEGFENAEAEESGEGGTEGRAIGHGGDA